MLLLLEKDGPSRVAAGQVGSFGGDRDHGVVERGEHMGCRLSILLYASGLTMSWKIDDSDMVQIACMQSGTLCCVPQTEEIRTQSSAEQQPAAVRRAM